VEWQAIRWTAHWQRGRIFERLEDWNAALSEYLTIIDAAQKSRQLAAQAHFGAGTAYAELGKIEQARAQFQKVLDTADPSWPVAVEARKALEALG
jgi:tetratricopeptide (TPR) repeat protein